MPLAKTDKWETERGALMMGYGPCIGRHTLLLLTFHERKLLALRLYLTKRLARKFHLAVHPEITRGKQILMNSYIPPRPYMTSIILIKPLLGNYNYPH